MSSRMIEDSQTLRRIGLGPKYSVSRYGSNVDPWVACALKDFDRDLYDSLYGFTRRGDGVYGMYKTFSHYGGENVKFHDLPRSVKKSLLFARQQTKVAFSTNHSLEPVDWDEAINALRRNTSAGISFVGTKGRNISGIRQAARHLAHKCKWQKGKFNPKRIKFPLCKAGFRGHLSSREDPKTRLVWIYPAQVIAIEAKFALPLYKFYKENVTPMMFGKLPTIEHCFLGSNTPSDQKYVGFDFSKFDATVPRFLIHWAFDIIKGYFNWNSWGGKSLSDTIKHRWLKVWDAVEWYFINTPILMPDGIIWRKFCGVPSGSYFTQIIDSVVNHVVITAMCYDQSVPCNGLRVLGDDSGFGTTPEFSVQLAVEFATHLGMEISSEKSEVVDTCNELTLLGFKKVSWVRARDDERKWFYYALYPERCPDSLSVSWSRIVGLIICGGSLCLRFGQFCDHYQSGYPVQSEVQFSVDTERHLTYGLAIDSLVDEVGMEFTISTSLWPRAYTFVM